MARCIRFLTALCAVFLAGLAVPETAYAWGPGAHMVTGNWVLQNLAVLPACVAEPLMRYPGLFLQGCLSADIFIGKGSKAKKDHSHNWESALAVLGRAKNPAQKAYAYGYLAHLAADTVAHNVFVPRLLPIAPGNGKMAHVYLEMQADRLLDWDKTDALSVFRERRSATSLALLRKALRKNPVKFGMQARVFRGSVALGGSNAWRRGLSMVDSLFPEHVRRPYLEGLLAVSTRAVVDVLKHGPESPVFSLDPIGAAAIEAAVAGRAKAGIFPVAGVSESLAALPETLQSLPAVCGKT
ncbi:MAG: hypothetical protein DELT_02927 [Desulfovibrio sp.]